MFRGGGVAKIFQPFAALLNAGSFAAHDFALTAKDGN